MKEHKGITLVALVITIIVLLILAGISITLVIGENEIIKKAQGAGNKHDQSVENEANNFNVFINEMDIYTNKKEETNFDELDNVQIWLKCIGNNEAIQPEDIVTNEELLKLLMQSEKAVDYMIKSKNIIMPAVVESKIAIKQLGLNEYATDKAVLDDKWRQSILASDEARKGLDMSNPLNLQYINTHG